MLRIGYAVCLLSTFILTETGMNILLFEYEGDTYRGDEGVLSGATPGLHYFDLVIHIEDEKWTVIKNRHGDLEAGPISALMQVKMFTMGQTIADLPSFYLDIPRGESLIAVHLEHDDNGNLKLTSTTFNEA